MASERALLEVKIIPDGINLVAMGPEADVLDCLAKVAVAWINQDCAPQCPDTGKRCRRNDPGAPPFGPTVPGSECCA